MLKMLTHKASSFLHGLAWNFKSVVLPMIECIVQVKITKTR